MSVGPDEEKGIQGEQSLFDMAMRMGGMQAKDSKDAQSIRKKLESIDVSIRRMAGKEEKQVMVTALIEAGLTELCAYDISHNLIDKEKAKKPKLDQHVVDGLNELDEMYKKLSEEKRKADADSRKWKRKYDKLQKDKQREEKMAAIKIDEEKAVNLELEVENQQLKGKIKEMKAEAAIADTQAELRLLKERRKNCIRFTIIACGGGLGNVGGMILAIFQTVNGDLNDDVVLLQLLVYVVSFLFSFWYKMNPDMYETCACNSECGEPINDARDVMGYLIPWGLAFVRIGTINKNVHLTAVISSFVFVFLLAGLSFDRYNPLKKKKTLESDPEMHKSTSVHHSTQPSRLGAQRRYCQHHLGAYP